MKLQSTLASVAMLGGIALSPVTASAMPVMNPARVAQTGLVQQASLVCNAWGHCWHRPYYGYSYYHPHYYGGWGWRWHPHYYGGWGWHPHYWGWRWHPHYYGGWGWHRWHHWHYW